MPVSTCPPQVQPCTVALWWKTFVVTICGPEFSLARSGRPNMHKKWLSRTFFYSARWKRTSQTYLDKLLWDLHHVLDCSEMNYWLLHPRDVCWVINPMNTHGVHSYVLKMEECFIPGKHFVSLWKPKMSHGQMQLQSSNSSICLWFQVPPAHSKDPSHEYSLPKSS